MQLKEGEGEKNSIVKNDEYENQSLSQQQQTSPSFDIQLTNNTTNFIENLETIQHEVEFKNPTAITAEEAKADQYEEKRAEKEKAEEKLIVAAKSVIESEISVLEENKSQEVELIPKEEVWKTNKFENYTTLSDHIIQFKEEDDEKKEHDKIHLVEQQQQLHQIEEEIIEDMATKLNPDAKEFVPSSPNTSGGSTTLVVPTSDDSHNHSTTNTTAAAAENKAPSTNGACSSPLLFGSLQNDDIIAQSPRKGAALNMDNIKIPDENEFQQEIHYRPGELSQQLDLALKLQDEDSSIHDEFNDDDCENDVEMNSKEAAHANEEEKDQINCPTTEEDGGGDFVSCIEDADMKESIYLENKSALLSSSFSSPFSLDSRKKSTTTQNEEQEKEQQQQQIDNETITSEEISSVEQMNKVNESISQNTAGGGIEGLGLDYHEKMISTSPHQQQQLEANEIMIKAINTSNNYTDGDFTLSDINNDIIKQQQELQLNVKDFVELSALNENHDNNERQIENAVQQNLSTEVTEEEEESSAAKITIIDTKPNLIADKHSGPAAPPQSQPSQENAAIITPVTIEKSSALLAEQVDEVQQESSTEMKESDEIHQDNILIAAATATTGTLGATATNAAAKLLDNADVNTALAPAATSPVTKIVKDETAKNQKQADSGKKPQIMANKSSTKSTVISVGGTKRPTITSAVTSKTTSASKPRPATATTTAKPKTEVSANRVTAAKRTISAVEKTKLTTTNDQQTKAPASTFKSHTKSTVTSKISYTTASKSPAKTSTTAKAAAKPATAKSSSASKSGSTSATKPSSSGVSQRVPLTAAIAKSGTLSAQTATKTNFTPSPNSKPTTTTTSYLRKIEATVQKNTVPLTLDKTKTAAAASTTKPTTGFKASSSSAVTKRPATARPASSTAANHGGKTTTNNTTDDKLLRPKTATASKLSPVTGTRLTSTSSTSSGISAKTAAGKSPSTATKSPSSANAKKSIMTKSPLIATAASVAVVTTATVTGEEKIVNGSASDASIAAVGGAADEHQQQQQFNNDIKA